MAYQSIVCRQPTLRDDALEQRRPHRAGEIGAAGDQRQSRAAAAVEPAADINVERRIDAAEADQADEQAVADPQRPRRPERRQRQPDADHQRAEQHGPASTDAVGDAPHHDAAEAGAEPGEGTRQRRHRARAAGLRGNVAQRDHRDPGGAVGHQHGDERHGRDRPRGTTLDRRGLRLMHCRIPAGAILVPPAQDLTTAPGARLVPMLHCAKVRRGGRGGNFVPGRGGTTKLTAGLWGVSFSPVAAVLRRCGRAYMSGRERAE